MSSIFVCTYKHKHVGKKSDQKNEAGVRRSCWAWRSSDFRDTLFAATVGTGPPSAAVICAVVISGQQGPPSGQQWLGWRSERKGDGLRSTTQRNEHISAQITTQHRLLQVMHPNETSFPKQMTHRKELRSLLEITHGLFGMTQHWKQNHYRWLVDTAYITYILFSDDRWRWLA